MTTTYETYEAKSILGRKYPVEDDWFWVARSINPYRGCEHNCTYCDGKADRYYIHSDYGTRIRIKKNAPELLTKELRKEGYFPINKPGWMPLTDFFDTPTSEPPSSPPSSKHSKPKYIIAVGGGVCDVYQPAERKFQITKKILEVLYHYNFPIHILTKSSLITRDLDILKKFPYVTVTISKTLVDRKLQKIFEPHSPSTEKRFELLHKLRSEGIQGGVAFMPILPFIGDTEENIQEIIRLAKEAKAEYVLPAGLTLKPGNKEDFLEVIRNEFPLRISDYEEIYQHGYSPDPAKYTTNVAKIGHNICKEYGILDRIPRYIPEGRISSNLKVAEELLNNSYLLQNVHQRDWGKAKKMRVAARAIEGLSHDISQSKIQELSRIRELNDSWLISIIQDLLVRRNR